MKRIGNRCWALIFAGVLLLPGCGRTQPEAGSQQAEATAAAPTPTPSSDVAAPQSSQVGIGTYVTEGGWGRLVIEAPKSQGFPTFSLDTENVDSGCTLSGQLDKSGSGVVYEGATPSQCSLALKAEPGGVAVNTSTKAQCQVHCGSNGSFEEATSACLQAVPRMQSRRRVMTSSLSMIRRNTLRPRLRLRLFTKIV